METTVIGKTGNVPLLIISSILFDVLTANLWNAWLKNHKKNIILKKNKESPGKLECKHPIKQSLKNKSKKPQPLVFLKVAVI